MSTQLKHAIALTFFTVFVLFFFKDVVVKGTLPVPTDTLIGLYNPWRDLYAKEYPRGIPFKNFLITDPIRQQIPWRKVAIDAMKQGHLPYWNQYSFSGTPLLGNIQAAVFYPLNFLFFLLPFPIAWTLLIVLEPLLSGLFLYEYLQEKKLSKFSSILGAVSWSFSGFSIAWLTWGTIVHVALWLPLILLCLEKIIIGKMKIKWSLLLACVLACSFLAGHIQIFFYVLLISGAYSAFVYFFLSKKDKKKRIRMDNKALLYAGSVVLILFFIITFLQWKEFFYFLSQSSRLSDASNWMKEGWFIPWQHAIQFIVPDFFGNPATLNYWGVWNYGEFIGYIGIIPLFLAIMALLFSKRMEIKFWLLILLFGIVFAFPTPLAKIPYQLSIPILSTLQPTRLIIVIVFSLCMLAAYGFDTFVAFPEKRKVIIPVAFLSFCLLMSWGIASVTVKTSSISTVIANFMISKRNLLLPTILVVEIIPIFLVAIRKRFRKVVLVIIIVMTMIDVYRFGKKFTPFVNAAYFFPNSEVLAFLQNQPGSFRIMATDDQILPPNVSAYYGIQDIGGYDPLYSSRYEQLIASLESGAVKLTGPFGFNRIIAPKHFSTLLFNLLNVQYVLSFDSLSSDELQFIFSEGKTKLYRVFSSSGPVTLIPSLLQVRNDWTGMQTLLNPNFNSQVQAVIYEPIIVSSEAPQKDEGISISSSDSQKLEVTVKTVGKRFLLFHQVYYPSIHVTINGQETKIYRADHALFGVVVPAGTFRIRVTYGP